MSALASSIQSRPRCCHRFKSRKTRTAAAITASTTKSLRCTPASGFAAFRRSVSDLPFPRSQKSRSSASLSLTTTQTASAMPQNSPKCRPLNSFIRSSPECLRPTKKPICSHLKRGCSSLTNPGTLTARSRPFRSPLCEARFAADYH